MGLYSGEGSQAANILNYVTIGISIVVLLAAIIYVLRKKKLKPGFAIGLYVINITCTLILNLIYIMLKSFVHYDTSGEGSLESTAYEFAGVVLSSTYVVCLCAYFAVIFMAML